MRKFPLPVLSFCLEKTFEVDPFRFASPASVDQLFIDSLEASTSLSILTLPFIVTFHSIVTSLFKWYLKKSTRKKYDYLQTFNPVSIFKKIPSCPMSENLTTAITTVTQKKMRHAFLLREGKFVRWFSLHTQSTEFVLYTTIFPQLCNARTENYCVHFWHVLMLALPCFKRLPQTGNTKYVAIPYKTFENKTFGNSLYPRHQSHLE